MHSNIYNEKNDFFSIIAVSLLFHFAVIATLLVVIWLKPVKENPLPIPFFELVNVATEQRVAPEPKPKSVPEPEPELAPEPEPELAPEPEPELAPEPKPEPVPEPTPKPKPVPDTPPVPAKETPAHTAPSMDMPMDMPSDIKKNDMDMPALKIIGDVITDQQLQAYLSRLAMLVHQNFNPPSGTEINSGTKSSVQFQIARNGEISEIVLRSSSGNSIWDRLAVRAIQITKPPPLPPSYVNENLLLNFDFREK